MSTVGATGSTNREVQREKKPSCCVRQGVSKIGVQKAGAPFVPWDWSEKYKPVLGPYKQLLGI